MKKILYSQLIVILLVGVVFADYKIIDDFEAYPFDAALKASWQLDDGADSQVYVDTSGGIQSSSAMAWIHPQNTTYTPWVVWNSHTFSAAQDWSNFSKVSIMLKGDNQNSSQSNAWFEILTTSGYSLAASYDTKLNSSDWQKIELEIDPADSWNNVGKIRFGFNHMGYPGLATRWDELRVEMGEFITFDVVDSPICVQEGGDYSQYTVALARSINEELSIVIDGGGQMLVDAGQGFAQQAVVNFDSLDWNEPKNVKIKAIDDELIEGDKLVEIVHRTESTSDQLNGIYKHLSVNVLDNERQCSVDAEDAMLGDLNLDCYVDFQDFVIIASQWLECNNPLYPEQCQYITHKTVRDKILEGDSPQIDTTYPYYKNRSAESIASEVELNGYDYVQLHAHYGLQHLEQICPLIDEFHKRELGVMAVLFAMCTYEPTAILPEGWENWKVEFLQFQPSYNFLSPVHQDYVGWMKQRLNNIFQNYDFDAFVFHETHWPVDFEYDNYCDVSDAFKNAFKAATGNDAFPNFTDATDPHYYLTDTALYNDLVQYRIDVVNDFYDEIVNGQDGLRQNFPELLIASWTLVTSWDQDMSVSEEFYGQDVAEMVQKVQPDMHFFQTNWPDWANQGISPDYSKQYAPFVNSVKQVSPDLPLGIQMDVSFNKNNKWYVDALEHAKEAGLDSTTYCEFSIRWDVYFEAPEPAKLIKASKKNLKLYFDQRLAESCSDAMVGRIVVDSNDDCEYQIISSQVDGNILMLELDRDFETQRILSIPVGGICDDPQIRFNLRYGDKSKGPQNVIPEGTYASLVVED